jgi:predicted nucleic acid-binding protein
MSDRKRILYDTRFIAAAYYSQDEDEKARIRRELTTNLSKYISSVTVYEICKLTLQLEGRQTADVRVDLLKRDFTIVNLDWSLARHAALIWSKYHVPMADAIIAATAMRLKAECVTNDEHFLRMKELKTRWI